MRAKTLKGNQAKKERHAWVSTPSWMVACLSAVRSIGENCLRQVTVHAELSNPGHSAAVTWILVPRMQLREQSTEPVFLNVYGTLESIPRNDFRQPL
jgi:hypothetical protein